RPGPLPETVDAPRVDRADDDLRRRLGAPAQAKARIHRLLLEAVEERRAKEREDGERGREADRGPDPPPPSRGTRARGRYGLPRIGRKDEVTAPRRPAPRAK